MFAMTSASLPIWRTFPLIGFISFPWRLLSLTGFILSFLCGGIFLIDFDAWRSGRLRLPYLNRILSLIVIGFLIVLTVGYCRVGSPVALPEQAFSPEAMQGSDGAALNGEYLPIWVDTSLKKLEVIKGGEVRIKSGNARFKEDVRTDMLSYQFSIEAETLSVVQLGTVYFPGWKAYDNEEFLPLEPEPSTGLLTMQLSPGTHHITIRFEDTPVRKWSHYISLGSAALVFGLFFLSLKKRL